MGFPYFLIFLMYELTEVYVDGLKETMYAKTSNQSIETWANAIGQTIRVPGHFHCAGHCLKNIYVMTGINHWKCMYSILIFCVHFHFKDWFPRKD